MGCLRWSSASSPRAGGLSTTTAAGSDEIGPFWNGEAKTPGLAKLGVQQADGGCNILSATHSVSHCRVTGHNRRYPRIRNCTGGNREHHHRRLPRQNHTCNSSRKETETRTHYVSDGV